VNEPAQPPREVLVLNGANLGRLGVRESAIYGTRSHDELAQLCVRVGRELRLAVTVRQTDAEDEIIGWLHEAADRAVPVVLNAAAWTHYSVAVRDAVAQRTAPLIEVHLSNPYAREEFRHVSLVSPVVSGVVAGLGFLGYELALRAIAAL